MIFPGLRQRPAMQYSYVEWSKVKLSIIHKLIWWIGSEELMHKGISPTPLPMLLKISKNPKQPSQCLAISTIKDFVIFQRLMKRKGCFTSISVHFAFQKGEKILHMQKMSVEVKTSMQKTTKAGQGLPFHQTVCF